MKIKTNIISEFNTQFSPSSIVWFGEIVGVSWSGKLQWKHRESYAQHFAENSEDAQAECWKVSTWSLRKKINV